MSASQALFWVALAALDLLLAVLIAGVKPRRLANLVAAVLVGANGLFGLEQAVVVGGAPNLTSEAQQAFTIFVNVPTLAAFIVFPFLFPRRRLKAPQERVLLGAAAGLVLVNWGILVARPSLIETNSPMDPVLAVTVFAPFFLGLCVGTLLLLNTYLSSPSPIQRNQARFILAAYAIKVATYLADFWDDPLLGRGGFVSHPDAWVAAYSVPLVVVLAAIPTGLLSSRLRRDGKGVPHRPLSHDAFVLAFPIAGFGLLYVGGLALEYMLVRPILFAYGILQYQLLDVDVRERRGVVSATILLSMVAVLVVVANLLDGLGVPASLATAIGFLASLGIGGIFLWPLVRLLLSPVHEEPEARGRELYRAALEEAVAGGKGHDTTHDRVLRALRARIGISDREHGVMEASVQALFGASPKQVGRGQTFLGRYRVEKVLGEGGFGRTFLARDEEMGRRIVLKVARYPSATEAKRLLREARAIARLHHPGIVTIYDVERVGDDCILVLEYVEKGSLADRLGKGPLPLPEAFRLLDDVLAGLEAAHAEGIVHRDIKPANILLARDGRAKLADFGIARAPAGSGTASGLTLEGAQAGSLIYMSPEQVRGEAVDARSDLYSFGVVAYEALAARPYLSFKGKAELDARLTILEETPRLPIPGIPQGLNELLADALAKDPDERPSSATAVRRRLARIRDERE